MSITNASSKRERIGKSGGAKKICQVESSGHVKWACQEAGGQVLRPVGQEVDGSSGRIKRPGAKC